MAWKELVLHNIARPKAIFILWLCLQKRLATKERLQMFGIMTDGLCVYCGGQETGEHLFFLCTETQRCFDRIMNWMGVKFQLGSWESNLKGWSKLAGGKTWKGRIF